MTISTNDVLTSLFGAAILGLGGWTLYTVNQHGQTLAVIEHTTDDQGHTIGDLNKQIADPQTGIHVKLNFLHSRFTDLQTKLGEIQKARDEESKKTSDSLQAVLFRLNQIDGNHHDAPPQ